MMNLSQQAKNEAALCPEWECCRLAALSAVIHTAGAINFSSGGMSVIVSSEHPGVCAFVKDAARSLYEVSVRIFAGKAVISGSGMTAMLIDLGILKISGGGSGNEKESGGISVEEGLNHSLTAEECCKKLYLKGVFLGCGSLTVPKSGGYSLEFNFASKRLRDDVKKLLEYFEIPSGSSKRPEKFRLYIKNNETISDFLALIGAGKAVLELNGVAAERDFMKSIARRANCDMANLDKMVSASLVQREAINKLNEIKDARLKAVADARLRYPDSSYEELAVILGISKSAVKYRLNKIVKMGRLIKEF